MGSYSQTNGGSTPVSTGGKGTNQAVGATAGGRQPITINDLPPDIQARVNIDRRLPSPATPPQPAPQQNYAYQQQPAWLSALASIFQPRQQPAFRYQAPTYAQMQQQANPNGWQAPPPVYVAPPPPPPAASQPAPTTQPNVQASVYDPGYYAAGRATGGRIEHRESAHFPHDVVERALAFLRREQ